MNLDEIRRKVREAQDIPRDERRFTPDGRVHLDPDEAEALCDLADAAWEAPGHKPGGIDGSAGQRLCVCGGVWSDFGCDLDDRSDTLADLVDAAQDARRELDVLTTWAFWKGYDPSQVAIHRRIVNDLDAALDRLDGKGTGWA